MVGEWEKDLKTPLPGPPLLLISNLSGWNMMVPFSGMGWQRRRGRLALEFEVPSGGPGSLSRRLLDNSTWNSGRVRAGMSFRSYLKAPGIESLGIGKFPGEMCGWMS